MRKQYFTISYKIYPYDVLVFLHGDFAELEKVLKSKLPHDIHHEIEDLNKQCRGRTIMFSSGQTIIWIRECNPEIISHEVFHAIDFLMRRIGCSLSTDSAEAYAYLTEYLIRKIYENKAIKKKILNGFYSRKT